MHRLSSSFVLGYHGCDRPIAHKLLAGELLQPSANEWDWLGPGAEANPKRGLEFSAEVAARNGAAIGKPAVVGAILELGLCLDLTTSTGTANNPTYQDLPATEEFRTLARLRKVIPAIDMFRGQAIPREEIAPLFGEEFNPGSWNVGHVVLNEKKVHILLVTLSKRGKAPDHQYLDHWLDDATFQWSTQNQTRPTDKKGREIIRHREEGIAIHQFVRDEKLAGGKGAPFVYHGQVEYAGHTGQAPMRVVFRLLTPATSVQPD